MPFLYGTTMREEVTIDGITFWKGQQWGEIYRGRVDRQVTVLGWNEAMKRIRIRGAITTWAQARRFNGKNGGYKLLD